MLSFKEYIVESQIAVPQLHDVNAIHRTFPDLLSKKKKPKLSWKQRRQHRRQKDRAGAISIGKKTGEVMVSEARNFTITNKFGGVKYKNITMATPSAPMPITKPTVHINHNYLSTTPNYYSQKDTEKMRIVPNVIKKKFKDFNKQNQKKTTENKPLVTKPIVKKPPVNKPWNGEVPIEENHFWNGEVPKATKPRTRITKTIPVYKPWNGEVNKPWNGEVNKPWNGEVDTESMDLGSTKTQKKTTEKEPTKKTGKDVYNWRP